MPFWSNFSKAPNIDVLGRENIGKIVGNHKLTYKFKFYSILIFFLIKHVFFNPEKVGIAIEASIIPKIECITCQYVFIKVPKVILLWRIYNIQGRKAKSSPPLLIFRNMVIV